MVVAIFGAALWSLPISGRWHLWHHSIGLMLVCVVGAVHALLVGDLQQFPYGALQGAVGLSASWVILELGVLGKAVGIRLRRLHTPRIKETTMTTEPNDKPNQPLEPKPGHDDAPQPADDDEPPPLYPPPPKK